MQTRRTFLLTIVIGLLMASGITNCPLFPKYRYYKAIVPLQPHICSQCSTKDFLSVVGAISLAGLAVYGLYNCYKHFYWNKERVALWAQAKCAEIHDRNYAWIYEGETEPPAQKFIEQITEFGLHAKKTRFDAVLRAAAPLHNAVLALKDDIRELYYLITECSKKRTDGDGIINRASMLIRALGKRIHTIRQTTAYQKEKVEIERIRNERASLQLQAATWIGQQTCHHNQEIVIIEKIEDNDTQN